MCYESASDFLTLSNGWLNILYFYYEDGFFRSSSQVFGFKVDRLDNIEYITKNNILVTSPEQTLYDLFINKRNIQSCLIGLLRYRDLYDKHLTKLEEFSIKRKFEINWNEKLQFAIDCYEDYD